MNVGVIDHMTIALAEADKNSLVVTGIGLGYKALCEFLYEMNPTGGPVCAQDIIDLRFKGIPIMPRPMRARGVALLINSR